MELNTARKRILAFLLLILVLPCLQQSFRFVESGKLYGAIVDSPNVAFTWDGWWTGAYQQRKSAYLNDSFGFRSDFVRLHNQIEFSLYNKLYSHGVVSGKNHIFFERSYIDEYCGVNYSGEDAVRKKLLKLKAIQDTLAHLGKTFVLVYAPSKAYYFPDDFPAGLECKGNTKNYYHAYTHIGDSLKINQIDCNGWFAGMKGKVPGHLLSKQGIHWTQYGALVAADSITRYIENVRNIKMPHLRWNKIEWGSAREQELDIVRALNLVFPVINEPYSHPVIIEDTAGKTKLNTIYLGDSYLWTFADNQIMQKCSKEWEFWYYNNEIFNEKVFAGKEELRHKDNFDWWRSLLQKDCLIMMYTEPNLGNLGNDFIESAYARFYP